VEEYKSYLANCDLQRRNDFDGRGHLSEEPIAAFTEFFLTVCLDQVSFMVGLMQPKALRERILGWAADEIRYGHLPATASKVLDAILFKGSLPRNEMADVIDQSDRSARNVTTALSKESIIFAAGPRDDWQDSLSCQACAAADAGIVSLSLLDRPSQIERCRFGSREPPL
jgi:hypothetical protein